MMNLYKQKLKLFCVKINNKITIIITIKNDIKVIMIN